jgi:hypothetical protein
MKTTRRRLAPYERAWTSATGAACAVGLLAAFSTLPLLVLAGLFVMIGMLGVMLVLPWLPDEVPWGRPLLLAGGVGGALTWVCVGLAELVGWVSPVVLLVLVVISPGAAPAWRRLMRWLGWGGAGHRPRASAAGGSRLEGPVILHASAEPAAVPQPSTSATWEEVTFEVPDLMSDQDLCHAWRSSFVALQRATSVEGRLRAVTMRALYLDELERRTGPAMRAWMQSGARAAGDPSRFLAAGTDGESPSGRYPS